MAVTDRFEEPVPVTNRQIDHAVRQEWGRVLAALLHRVRQIELAEDALQDAYVAALSHWPNHGMPKSPRAWLLRTAERKAIDAIRRAKVFQTKQQQLAILRELEGGAHDDDPSPFPDDRLKLIFTCCHPALPHEASVALTLKTICGLNTPQIARAFLVSETTMAQRIVRAKRKISVAGIPYTVPDAELWGERMAAVLAVIYFIFNEGYAALKGDTHARTDLCEEAIRLGRIVTGLVPAESEAAGLLALMLLHHSRRYARLGREGEIIPLDAQDRDKWEPDDIAEGLTHLMMAGDSASPGPYTLQASLSAVHARAKSFAETDWLTMIGLYDQLYAQNPSPVVLLNRAVAVSYSEGPQAGLAALKALEIEPRLAKYQPFHAARADMLARAGRNTEAHRAYDRALELTQNVAEREFLEKKRKSLTN